jgi:glycosyltransferase involved in cell wall biosynthesis
MAQTFPPVAGSLNSEKPSRFAARAVEREAAARKVCHLIDSNLGSEFFRSIAREHDRQRFPVMIGSIEPAGRLQTLMKELNTPTFALGAAAKWQLPAALARLVGLLRRERVALVHAHCFYPTGLGLLAARLAGVPFVYTRHHSDHHIRIYKHRHTWVDGWHGRLADHVIAVSHVTRQIMMEVEGVAGSQITVVYNGMQPLREPDAASVARVRQELGLGAENVCQPVCLMLARMHEEKGHRYLFEAIPQIIERAGPLTVLLAGEGPHRAEIEAEAQSRGLQNVVRFLGHRKDVPELIVLSTLVTLPSLAESFGYAPLEAMSLGKPVVVAATGGMPEVVADGECGLIVPQKDAQALAAAICRVLQEPDLARALGEAGRRRAKLFAFENMIRGYERVYEQVIAPPAKLAKELCEVSR